jgi:hypothetical protein
MLRFSLQSSRSRPTLLGLMMAVFVSGVSLGCVAEMRRIKRAQSYFRQQAAHFAQLETLERDVASLCLSTALSCKQTCEENSAWIKRVRTPGDSSFPNSRVRAMEKDLKQSFIRGRYSFGRTILAVRGSLAAGPHMTRYRGNLSRAE